MQLPSLAQILEAQTVVYGHMPPTPQYTWPLLNRRLGAEAWIKHENHTPVGAFKLRGALVYMDWLRNAHPELTGLVFDLPHVVDGARAAALAAGVADRFAAVAGDFFAAVPRADYYLLKWILHDWRDEDCLRILRNCRAAGGPGARMLIVEALIGATEGAADDRRPDLVALFDMNMLAATDGKQRTLAELDELFAAAGWRRVAMKRSRSTDSLLELAAL